MKRNLILTGLIILLTIAFASCQSEPSPTSPPPTPTQAEMQPVTVVDALGREVTFASPPERIVVAGRATTLVVNAVYLFPEAQERLVAFESRSQRGFDFYPIIQPHFDEFELLEKNAGPEQIVPLRPDLVIMKSYMADSLGVALEEIDIPVIYVDLETPEQFERDIAIIGSAMGDPVRTEEIIDFYNTRLDKIAAKVESAPEADRPEVLLMQYSDEEGEIAFEVPSVNWLQTELVTLAGGIPVWTEAAESGGWTVVGFEQIAVWNPDKIFVINYAEDSAAAVESLKQNPNWMALDAVQQGEIYGFPGDFWSWDQPDPRWILGLTWMTTKMLPELTTDINVHQEVIDFYAQMYGLSPEVIESEILPLIQSGLD
jgi:iron complex transport system substrate-binding protein